jgi:glycosyltransferase involved in cell wall biosynthesis
MSERKAKWHLPENHKRRTILFIECGQSGYGGSFQCLYLTIKSQCKEKFHFIVFFLNPSHFYDKLMKMGVECYYIEDIIFSGNHNWRKYILGKLNGFVLRVIPLFSVWCDFIVHSLTIYRILTIVKNKKIDIIHLNNQIVLNYFGLCIAKILNIQCISHLRTFNSYGLTKSKISYANEIGVNYMAISEQIKNYWIEKGLPLESVATLYDPYPRLYENYSSSNNLEFIDSHGGYKLVFFGRLIERNGIPFLIETFKMILSSGIQAKLYLVGSGEEENRLRDLVYCQELGEDVIFLGYSSDPLAIIKRMDLLILPSKEEGLGRVLLEAMDIGIPVIGTEVGGIPEVIDNEVNGLLVPYGDKFALKEAILRVLNDEVLRQNIINAGFHTLQSKFNEECYSKKLENVYSNFA